MLGLLFMTKYDHPLQALTEEQQENRELLITLGKEGSNLCSPCTNFMFCIRLLVPDLSIC